MSHHYGKEDLKKLAKFGELAPQSMQAFQQFDRQAFAEGAINVKTKELIAVAAAHITRCPYCIDAHTRRAKKAGATDQEIAESIMVATAMSAGASLAHGVIAMDSLGQ
ncbi:MAG: carboxymuconolactone decarboxylase family protein [Candidatus Tectomicrobia bacterium]|uniref:Carboxymuconolactone decarboxylase family protein n=1 Tax=Tectimicrobiota bacterium TaxID=2528274 RepID=A0A932CMJ0_UNCTE|nr:carboxymuconolactone decarboxylase family protein [Candidatus Tectomicrobia bacterium]